MSASSRKLMEKIESQRREIERLNVLIDYHNHTCQSACGFGELEAVRCQYRPYFVATGRRCPECPTDWMIERRGE